MKLEVSEQDNEKLILFVRGEDHTLLNILKDNAWKAGAKQASYMIKHPYMSDPKLIVRGKKPKNILIAASQMAIDDAKEFSVLFSREMKKK